MDGLWVRSNGHRQSCGGSSGLVSVLYRSCINPSPSPAESLAQQPGFTLKVPQLVSMQEGLCVLVLSSYDTDNSWARLYRYWYKDPANVGWDPPVASSNPSRGVSQETLGRFQLAENPADGDCSLQISDARRTDAGRYFLRVEKGSLRYSYHFNSYEGKGPVSLKIQISPAHGLPGTLLAGEPVTVTCTAPGRCSGPPPRVTWTGPFSDTARDVSAQLANGTWAHSSALSFTPGPGDHGEELVCTVTYRPPQGPSTRRTVRLHVGSEDDVVSLETWEGDSLSLGCEAGNRPEAALSWAKGNESLSPSQGRAGHLELLNLSRGDAGEYRCWAKNPFGSASRTLRVHVQTLEKTLQITVSRANRNPGTLVVNGSQLTAREGDSLRFVCSVASNPPAVLGWVKGGRAVEGTCPVGENQLRLELPNVTAEDGGLYRCWAQNKESSAQGTFQLLTAPGRGLG
uniref:Ig-like domain-containing protein n=1 Tax=Gopherus evgoodei TaxID=1825980 RepID=A0A8C4Y8J5_9SAUR